MYRFFLAALDTLPGAVILIPVYWILNKALFHNARKSTFYCLFSFYLVAVYVLVGMPDVTYIRPELNLNLIPVLGLIDDWKNSILNVLLFVPLGIMLPVLWDSYRSAKNTVLFGLGMSLAIEILQIFTFRATDVNDLITNVLGTFLGYSLGNMLVNKFPAIANVVKNNKASELYIVCAIVLGVMFFIYPFISSFMWDIIF